MAEEELIPLNEAAKRLGVSKMTMARLVKDGVFTIYRNPLDKRLKLVDAREVADRTRIYREPAGKMRAAA